MSLDAKNDISARIEDAVFELMGTTPVQAIKVTDVLSLRTPPNRRFTAAIVLLTTLLSDLRTICSTTCNILTTLPLRHALVTLSSIRRRR